MPMSTIMTVNALSIASWFVKLVNSIERQVHVTHPYPTLRGCRAWRGNRFVGRAAAVAGTRSINNSLTASVRSSRSSAAKFPSDSIPMIGASSLGDCIKFDNIPFYTSIS